LSHGLAQMKHGSGALKFPLVNGAGTTTYWSNDGTNGSQLLAPDQRITPQGYLSDGAVTASKLSSAIGLWTAQRGDILRPSGKVGIGLAASAPFGTLTVERLGFQPSCHRCSISIPRGLPTPRSR